MKPIISLFDLLSNAILITMADCLRATIESLRNCGPSKSLFRVTARFFGALCMAPTIPISGHLTIMPWESQRQEAPKSGLRIRYSMAASQLCSPGLAV